MIDIVIDTLYSVTYKYSYELGTCSPTNPFDPV